MCPYQAMQIPFLARFEIDTERGYKNRNGNVSSWNNRLLKNAVKQNTHEKSFKSLLYNVVVLVVSHWAGRKSCLHGVPFMLAAQTAEIIV